MSSSPKSKSTLPPTASITDRTLPPAEGPPEGRPVAQIVIIWRGVENQDGTVRLLDPSVEEVGIEHIPMEAAFACSSLGVRYMELSRIFANAAAVQRQEAEQLARQAQAGVVHLASKAEMAQIETMQSISH